MPNKQPIVLMKNGQVKSGAIYHYLSAEEVTRNINPQPTKSRCSRFCNALVSFFSCSSASKQEESQARQSSQNITPPLAQNANSLFYHQAPCSAAPNDALDNDEVKQSNLSAYI